VEDHSATLPEFGTFAGTVQQVADFNLLWGFRSAFDQWLRGPLAEISG